MTIYCYAHRSDNLGIHVRTAILINEELVNIAEIFVIIGPLKAMLILYVDIPVWVMHYVYISKVCSKFSVV